MQMTYEDFKEKVLEALGITITVDTKYRHALKRRIRTLYEVRKWPLEAIIEDIKKNLRYYSIDYKQSKYLNNPPKAPKLKK